MSWSVHMAFGMPQSDVIASMERFQRDVLPRFADRPVVEPDFDALAPLTTGERFQDMPFGGGVGSLDR